MHISLPIALAFSLFMPFSANAIDCTKDIRANQAKANMSEASDGQMCANALQFYAYLCECKNNPRTTEQARNLKLTLEKIKGTYNNYGAYCRGIGRISDAIPTCRVGTKSGKQTGDTQSMTPGSGSAHSASSSQALNYGAQREAVFDGKIMGLLNDLAGDSQNETFQTMVNEMNQNTNRLNTVREFSSMFGPLSKQDHNTLTMVENFSQAISIGKAIFGDRKKAKKQKPRFSQSQINARKKSQEISKTLRVIYDEVAAVPTFFEFNEHTLDKLDAIEDRIRHYESSTAKARLHYWEYVDSKGYPTEEEMNAELEAIHRLEETGGVETILDRIAQIQATYDTDKALHLANAEQAFASTLDTININKVRCYRALGQVDKAEQFAKKVNYSVSVSDAVNLLQDAYNAKDYYSAIKYYQVINEFFKDETEVKLVYIGLSILDYDYKGLPRSDINYLLALGVLSYIKTNQISGAYSAMESLRAFQERSNMAYMRYKSAGSSKKAYGATVEDYRLETEKGKALALAAEAYLLSNSGKHDNALSKIDEAIELERLSPTNLDSFGKYRPWLFFIKAEVLVAKGDYAPAKSLIAEIKRKTSISAIKYKAIDKHDVSYLRANIRYLETDYQGALMSTSILLRKLPKSPRLHALLEQIHVALNNHDLAETSRESYQQILTEE